MSTNIFAHIAELSNVSQNRLCKSGLICLCLSSTGGVPIPQQEEVLGASGFNERSLENSYGCHPNVITIRFHKHVVHVDGMELRAKVADVMAHMSNQWTFRHGSDSVQMEFEFSRDSPCTGRLNVNVGSEFTDEIQWT